WACLPRQEGDRRDVCTADRGPSGRDMAYRRGGDPRGPGVRGMGLYVCLVESRFWNRYVRGGRWPDHAADGEFQDHRKQLNIARDHAARRRKEKSMGRASRRGFPIALSVCALFVHLAVPHFAKANEVESHGIQAESPDTVVVPKGTALMPVAE